MFLKHTKTGTLLPVLIKEVHPLYQPGEYMDVYLVGCTEEVRSFLTDVHAWSHRNMFRETKECSVYINPLLQETENGYTIPPGSSAEQYTRFQWFVMPTEIFSVVTVESNSDALSMLSLED